jgi:hypothetical protein
LKEHTDGFVCDCMEMFCEKEFRVKREAEVSEWYVCQPKLLAPLSTQDIFLVLISVRG